METEIAEFAGTFQKFMEVMVRGVEGTGDLTELGVEVCEFLGRPLKDIDPVTETFPAHQVVDLDQALNAVCGRSWAVA